MVKATALLGRSGHPCSGLRQTSLAFEVEPVIQTTSAQVGRKIGRRLLEHERDLSAVFVLSDGEVEVGFGSDGGWTVLPGDAPSLAIAVSSLRRPRGTCDLHNQTMTISVFRERAA